MELVANHVDYTSVVFIIYLCIIIYTNTLCVVFIIYLYIIIYTNTLCELSVCEMSGGCYIWWSLLDVV